MIMNEPFPGDDYAVEIINRNWGFSRKTILSSRKCLTFFHTMWILRDRKCNDHNNNLLECFSSAALHQTGAASTQGDESLHCIASKMRFGLT
mmetsp:Transcript_10325/g.14602  ORF Transcript_10325/g.14602 Transcript_10325/m.14602 type:complete len:92 (+) Transcript_10325:98-373(+)